MPIEIGVRADAREEPRGEVAPVTKVCRKRGPDLASAKLEQSVTRATSEGVVEAARQGGRQLEEIARGREQQVAAWGQRKTRHQVSGETSTAG
jgi:hypothetical protein